MPNGKRRTTELAFYALFKFGASFVISTWGVSSFVLQFEVDR